MENEYEKHESEYITAYQKKGYTSNFRFEAGKLIGRDAEKAYSPNVVYIVAEHRFEGMSNPSDMSILYILKTNSNEKGTFQIGYGPNTDLDATEFFKDIPKANCSNSENLHI